MSKGFFLGLALGLLSAFGLQFFFSTHPETKSDLATFAAKQATGTNFSALKTFPDSPGKFYVLATSVTRMKDNVGVLYVMRGNPLQGGREYLTNVTVGQAREQWLEVSGGGLEPSDWVIASRSPSSVASPSPTIVPPVSPPLPGPVSLPEKQEAAIPEDI